MSSSAEQPRKLRADLDELCRKVDAIDGVDAEGVAGLKDQIDGFEKKLDGEIKALNERLDRQDEVIAGMKNVVKSLQKSAEGATEGGDLPLDDSPAVEKSS